MKKIVIDAGHGGKDPGAVGNGLYEKDLTLKISKHMQNYLEDNYTGHEIKLTRTSDIFHELSKRADIANNFDADVFVSNHVNAGKGTGYESFIYNKPNAATIALQNVLNAEALTVAKKYGLGSHGEHKKRGNLAVVRETKMPAILTETCFIDSKDAALLKKDAFLKDMAEAYAKGIAKHLGLPEKPKSEKQTVTGKLYRVQVGAFKDKKNAEKLAADLKKKGYPTIIL
ncbi:N-acetylmuramoyl-L-alanine amidase [Bacillus sp. ISL-57]|uniref:N-acetylmuramoyl-L-alanine amidase n=1 Tax=Bacillus sp. ISL-57 TaxID=2819135 RepID=UPI001BEA7DBC|nr:N-acetylmuramoyl-L-alanine amidase [Bacillus sp. ISL-57]MBT2718317.1 N-acetylmuramoyl-L-alanine amidase [Bacillus sp. ISL-57]